MFIDECRAKFQAGNGGHGCLSFRREKYIPKGGPDGGDGGRGGDVYLVCDRNTQDFTDYYFQPQHKADNGQPGKGSQKHGKSARALELKVPEGTVLYDEQTGAWVCELTEHGQKTRVLRGGVGGLGNLHFRSSTNQVPRQTTKGRPGAYGEYRLVLKTVADVGLVGFPNAGKSSMLELLTNARPKTAAYPFTTLYPHVGVMEFYNTYQTCTLADIPGLIEGAAQNKGLGHRFLKHIERCRLLMILIDLAGTDGRPPHEDYATLLQELRAYSEAIVQKPQVVVANKIDEEEAQKNLETFRRENPQTQIYPVSILSEEGIPELKEVLLNRWQQVRLDTPDTSTYQSDVSVEDNTPSELVQHA